MSNDYFNFKQFTIHQDHCAMKVGTDGVLLGAWANVNNAEDILDIGTGTGVIALMMAQRSKANITAIEINESAYNQSKENFIRSQWNNHIEVYHTSLQDFTISTRKKYDLIISNPPYFNKTKQIQNQDRAVARENQYLSLEELFSCVSKLISAQGRFCLILPQNEEHNIRMLSEVNQLYINRISFVKPNAEKPPKRILLEISKNRINTQSRTITIEKKRHQYSDEYIELTKDFYLNF
jgi:tRNA1Val (adenine37-N6)-methyltransferase